MAVGPKPVNASFDFDGPIAFSAALDRAVSKGLVKYDALSLAQMKAVWRHGGKEIVRASAATAPVSGRRGTVVWRHKGYSYEGKHGDIGRQLGYSVSPYRSGKGVRVAVGPMTRRAGPRKRLAGVVGRFAVANVRRTPGRGAKVGPRRDWVGAAARRLGMRQARTLVEAHHRAAKATVDKETQRLRKKGVGVSPWG